MKRILPAVVVLIAVAAIYLQVVNFEYAWDDLALFIDSPALRSGSDLVEAITRPILPGTSYFRPAVLFSFFLEFKYLGLNAAVSHGVNLLFFLLNIALVGAIAWRLFPERRHLPALAMLLYGLHPAMIESAAWVAGRFDLMVTFFVLFGLFCYLSTTRVLIRATACGFAFFCAAASKEMAVVYPLLLGVIALIESRHQPLRALPGWLGTRRDLWVVVSVLGAGIVYLALRHHFLSSMATTDERVASLSLFERVAFVGHTVLFYLRVCFLPFMDLGTMHPFDPSGTGAAQKVIGLVGLIAFCAFCVWALIRRSVSALLALAWCLAILPVSNVLPLTVGGNIGHERFMALPLAFLCIWVAYALSGLLGRGRVTAYMGMLVGAWLIVSVFNLLITIPLWRNDVTLWVWSYNAHPEVPITQFTVVASYLRADNLDEAGKYLEKIEAFYDDKLPPRLLAIKGQWLQRKGRYQESVSALKKALSTEMLPHELLKEHGVDFRSARVDLGSFNEAWYLRFLYGALAENYVNMRRFDEAIDALEIEEFYQPDYAPAQLLKALAYYGKNDIVNGDINYQKAKSFYTPAQWPGADNIKNRFLAKLCFEPNKPIDTCARWVVEFPASLAHE
ncbi:hypothetical protein ACAW63_09665 [Pseudomonas sp. QE6]|uniref:hypothetical protein n=1 Tax=Pseudomonas sp. QE6 TaxID=3242491 RepID=UPI0035270BAC